MGKIILNGVDYSAPVTSGITGIKGNAETFYRTGNVNLTTENIGALSLNGGTMNNNAIIYMKGNGTLIDLSYANSATSITHNRIGMQDAFSVLSFHSKVSKNASGCGIKAYNKDNGIESIIRFYSGNTYCESQDTFSIKFEPSVSSVDGLLSKEYIFSNNALYPFLSVDLGMSAYKWKDVYATNGVIQTSDRTKKTDINELNINQVKSFINGLNPVSYKMIDGTSGRTHYGFIAQDIEELMKKLDMDSSDFAGFIKSPKKITKYEDENGKKLKKPVEEVIENEYDYALRYDEFIAPLIKVVQEQQKEIENLKKALIV